MPTWIYSRYPDGRWFTALARADDEYRRLGPLKPVIPANQSPETSGVHDMTDHHMDYEDDLSRSVNVACTRWLEQHEQRAWERAVYNPGTGSVWTPSPCGT